MLQLVLTETLGRKWETEERRLWRKGCWESELSVPHPHCALQGLSCTGHKSSCIPERLWRVLECVENQPCKDCEHSQQNPMYISCQFRGYTLLVSHSDH